MLVCPFLKRLVKHTVKFGFTFASPIKHLDRNLTGRLHLSVEENHSMDTLENLPLNNGGKLKSGIEEQHVAGQSALTESLFNPPDEISKPISVVP